MKGLLKFLVGAVLGGVLGWGLGYLRIPLIENNGSFWIGFAVSLSVVLFVVAGLFVWNKNSLLMKAIGRNSGGQTESNPARAYRLVWVIVAFFVAGGGTISGWMIYRQNAIWTTRIEDLKKTILNQAELVESVRKSNQGFLMGNVLDKIDAELALRPKGPLNEATIDRVAALSHSLKPYRYFEGDTLSSKALSPERGQLLLALVNMEIDSASWTAIKSKATFAAADLSGANLRGKDLSGMNLRGANFRGGDISQATLCHSDLWYACFWGATANNTNLSHAQLVRADLHWAQLNNSKLIQANLNGANFANAQLRNVDLLQATFRYGSAEGALFHGAHLTEVDFLVTDLSRTILTNADLSESNLRLVNLKNAHLEGINLTNARVGQGSWEKILEEWQFVGNLASKALYVVEKDTTARFEAAYVLSPIR